MEYEMEEMSEYDMSPSEKEEWYANHTERMLETGEYYNPCNECGGEDCGCCDYGRGY